MRIETTSCDIGSICVMHLHWDPGGFALMAFHKSMRISSIYLEIKWFLVDVSYGSQSDSCLDLEKKIMREQLITEDTCTPNWQNSTNLQHPSLDPATISLKGLFHGILAYGHVSTSTMGLANEIKLKKAGMPNLHLTASIKLISVSSTTSVMIATLTTSMLTMSTGTKHSLTAFAVILITSTWFKSLPTMATTAAIAVTRKIKCNGILVVPCGVGLGSSRNLRRGVMHG
jgi:hypothetical protein